MLHVDLPPYSVGGVARQVDLLASTLTSRGHDVLVYSTSRATGASRYAVQQVSSRGSKLSRVAGVAAAFRQATRSSTADVLHGHGDDWLVDSRIPRVRTFYGSAWQEARSAQRFRRRAGQTFAYGTEWLSGLRADITTTISETTRDQLPFVQRVIPCAVPAPFFDVPEPSQLLSPRVLYVAGTLGGRKRGQLVIEAVRQAREQIPDLRLRLVCPEPSTEDFIDWLPNLTEDELAREYGAASVLCSASSYEGFGVPYAEALAAGVPVVTTTNPGALEVLDQGRLGVVSRDDELATRLLALLQNRTARQDYARTGRQAALRYRPEAVAQGYEELYETALAKHRRRR